MEPVKREIHTIDATGQSLGRLATKVSLILRGKHKPGFAPYKDEGDVVVVRNIREMRVTGKKMDQKTYYHHSGYLGSMRETKLKELFKRSSSEVLRKAIWGMLPRTKLRKEQIKRLTVEE